ncbi:hypothetical protein [Arthrobacter sp. UYCo732]
MSQSHEDHNKPFRSPIDLTVRLVVGSVVIIGVAVTFAVYEIFFNGAIS